MRLSHSHSHGEDWVTVVTGSGNENSGLHCNEIVVELPGQAVARENNSVDDGKGHERIKQTKIKLIIECNVIYIYFIYIYIIHSSSHSFLGSTKVSIRVFHRQCEYIVVVCICPRRLIIPPQGYGIVRIAIP